MFQSSPVHSVSGRHPSHSVSAVSTSGYTSPCALCWVRPSCSTSTPRRTLSNHFWNNTHDMLCFNNSLTEKWPTTCRQVSSIFSIMTHGGGLSGRPSDLSFRCLSALVRVDLTISPWVMFNSGCCWMYSRMVSWNIANKPRVSAPADIFTLYNSALV